MTPPVITATLAKERTVRHGALRCSATVFATITAVQMAAFFFHGFHPGILPTDDWTVHLLIVATLLILGALSGLSSFVAFATNLSRSVRDCQQTLRLGGRCMLGAWIFLLLLWADAAIHERCYGFGPFSAFVLATSSFLVARHGTLVHLLRRSERGLEATVIEPSSCTLVLAGAKCPVCGEAFEGVEPVLCEECSTPHHPACWNFVGHCSLFGCRGQTTVPRSLTGHG